MSTKLTSGDVLALLAAKPEQNTSRHYLNNRLAEHRLPVLSAWDTSNLWPFVKQIVRASFTARELEALETVTCDPVALITACAVHGADMDDFYFDNDREDSLLESAADRGTAIVNALRGLIASAATSAKYPTQEGPE